MPHDALEIARRIVAVGIDPFDGEDSASLSQMRLQKLLYYCQGWSLGLLGEPLFSEAIEAWVHGPVVPSVYSVVKSQRDKPISQELIGLPTHAMSKTVIALIEMVWCRYAQFTPSQLRAMTHEEPAWKEARQGYPDTERCSVPLKLETMQKYFQSEVTKVHTPGYNLADSWQAELHYDLTNRNSQSASEVFANLGIERN
jgi:uncharacterized phage-associated protein